MMILTNFFRNIEKAKKEINQKIRSKYYSILLNNTGKNLTVYGKIIIKAPENIRIGENCKINDNVFIHGAGGVEIADNVTISAFAKILSIGYETSNWSEIYDTKIHKFSSVYIGEGTWICCGATILPGVSIIGKGVILAANTVVAKNIVEDFVVVAGNPAKIVNRY